MIVSSFNIRGLGGKTKRNKIKALVNQHKVDFMAIQETKMEVISNALCYKLWGARIVIGFSFLPKEIVVVSFLYGVRLIPDLILLSLEKGM